MSLVDENKLTELEIAPDGRIYLFGASAEMLEILSRLFSDNQAVQLRHEQIQRQTSVPAAAVHAQASQRNNSHE